MSAQPLKLTKGENGTFRLTNMDIGEVSLVDRAANKRKFILAKREDTMPTGTELKENQDGSLVLEKDQGADTSADSKDKGTPPDAPPPEEVDKAIDLPAAKKAELAPLAHKLVEAALHFHNQVVGAKEVKEGGAVPDTLAEEAKAVKAAAGELNQAVFGQADGDAAPSDTAGEAQVEEDGKGGAGSASPAQSGKSKTTKVDKADEVKIRKVAELHAKLLQEHLDAITTLADEIAKAESLDLDDLNDKIRAMSDLGWKLEDVAQVVNVSKDAEGNSPIDVSKVAKLHAQLLAEKIAAIKTIAGDIADNAATMELEDLRAKIRALRDMGWRVQDDAVVTNVGKSMTDPGPNTPVADGSIVDVITDADLEAMAGGVLPDGLAKVGRKMSGRNLANFNGALGTIRGELEKLFQLYRALLPADQQDKADALHKRLIEDMGLPDVPEDNAGGSFTWPESPAGSLPDAAEPGPAKDTLATLEKQVAAKEAEAKELRVKLAKAEQEAATVPPPSSAQPDGHQATPVVKGTTTDAGWPMDMNSSEYRRKVASGETT